MTKSMHELFLEAPAKVRRNNNHIYFLTVLIFLVIILFLGFKFTGYFIAEDNLLFLSEETNKFNLDKKSQLPLSLNINSEVLVSLGFNLDCSENYDYFVPNIKKADFTIKNNILKNSDNYCIIVINKEYPKQGYINLN
ncbi:hypothetical protein K8R47_00725 [archaeon]|nr:hypothetical protein [archaeon]